LSPIEKECLRILLRGGPTIIICPARSLPQRVPPEWTMRLADGRLLILSAFAATEKRVIAELSFRRNELVAAFADEIHIVHATPGGHLEHLARRLRASRARFPAPSTT
jgi:hypothetical protein